MAHVYRNKPERDDTNWLTNPHHLAAAITPVALPHTTRAAPPVQVAWDDGYVPPGSRLAWWQTWLPLGTDAPCLHVLPGVIAEMTSVNEHVVTPDPMSDDRLSPASIKGNAVPMPQMQRLCAATQTIQTLLTRHIAQGRASAEPLAVVIAQALTVLQDAFAFTAAHCWLASIPQHETATAVVIQGNGEPLSPATTQALSELAQRAYQEQRRCQSYVAGAGITMMAMPLGQDGARYGALVCARALEQPLRDDEICIAEVIAMQITGALVAEEQLVAARASEQFWNTVYDSQPDGFILYDKHHNIIKYSQAALNLAANRAEVIATRETHQPITPIWNTRWFNEAEITDEDAPSICAIMARKQTNATQIWVRPDPTKPQTKIPVLVSAAPIVDAAANIQGAVVRFQDITSMKAVESLKLQLVKHIQHDIRTPLTLILVKAQMLRKYPENLTTQKLSDYVSGTEAAIANISTKLNNLADLDNAIGDPPVLMSLVDHVWSYLHDQRQHYGSRRIQCQIEAVDSALEGYWSPREIDSVIDNLIQNAIKYSPDDSPIIVRLYPTEREGKRMAHMAVIDQGYGVPAADKARIFENEYRSVKQTPNGRDIPGTGMGLNFCYTAVRMHEGKIWVESPGLGRGSTFHVELPLV